MINSAPCPAPGGQCARGTAAEFIPAVLSDKDAAKYMDVIVYHGYDCQYEDDGDNHFLPFCLHEDE